MSAKNKDRLKRILEVAAEILGIAISLLPLFRRRK